MKNKYIKIATYIGISIVSTLLIIVGALYIASAPYKEKTYLEPWGKDYHENYKDKRTQIIAHGILAANAHNKQNWIFKYDKEDKNKMTFYMDPSRLLPVTDPHARQSTISQGTILEHMRVAAEELGYSLEIRIFPNGEFNDEAEKNSVKEHPIAEITVEDKSVDNTALTYYPTNSEDISKLYDMIFLPDVSRYEYEKDPLTPEQVTEITGLASDFENIEILVFQNEKDLEAIREFTKEGVKIEASKKDAYEETKEVFRNNENEKNEYRDGITFEGGGTTGGKKIVMEGITTILPFTDNQKAFEDTWNSAAEKRASNTPNYVFMITKDNSRTTQVETGILYSRLQLHAATYGLSLQPQSQVLEEFEEMSHLYEQIHKQYTDKGETIQMLIRIGRSKVEAKRSPRRDVEDFIVE